MKKIIFILIIISCQLYGYAQIIRKEIPDKLVVFTFDDATASQYSFVVPLLKRKTGKSLFSLFMEFPILNIPG